MDRQLHQVHDAEKLFYYFFSENESNNLVLRLVLRSRIDKSILKKALNKTLERYPNFRQTPVIDKDGYLFTRDNDQEAEVYPYDPEPVNLAGKATNGYLFRVMFEADTLWISIFHSLCDGSGFKMFTRSFLYHYFTLSGITIRNEDKLILTEAVPADSSELADPFDLPVDCAPTAASISEDGTNPFKTSDLDNIFLLPESIKTVDQCSHHSLCRYILDTDKLLSQAKEAGSTVDTYLHLLTARAIHDNYKVGDKLISGIGTVDVRPYYDNKYLQNNVDLFWLYFGDSFFGLSDSDACQIIGKEFKQPQLNKELFDSLLAQKKTHYKELFDFPITDTRRLKIMREVLWRNPEVISTYFSTNLIRLDLGEDLEPLVAHADIYGSDIFRSPVLFIMTHGKETSINLVWRSLNRYFPSRLKEAFKKEGLLVSAKLGDSFEGDKIWIDQLPRL